MTAIRAVAFWVFSFALCAQTVPNDVSGWDKIKWGMTISAVRAAYSIDAQPTSADGWTLLTLAPVKIANVRMDVQVEAREGTDKITAVRLWSFFGLAGSAPQAGAQDFDALRTKLIQEYGQPAKEEMKRGENFHLIKTVLWTFPSSSILLTLEQSAALPNLGDIYVDYTATNK